MPPAAPDPAPDHSPDAAAAAAAAPAPAAGRRASGPARVLQTMGLDSPLALALHLPLRYEDETRLTPLAQARAGETRQIEARVVEARVELRPRRQLVVRLADDDGEPLVLRFLHFYPSHQKALQPGVRVRARGELRGGFFGLEMVHPQFKALPPGGAPLAAALTPVYPASAGLPQAYLRKAVAAGLQRADLAELLPPGTVPAGLPPLRAALQFLHHPPPQAPLAALQDHSHPAWQRLKFEELLAQQLAQAQSRRERGRHRAPVLAARPGGLHERLLAQLPFALTAAQRRVAEEIAADLAAGRPMHRLLQGDVGAGKTVVAALAAAIAIDAGWQCALMAPTEILAEQHFAKLLQWLQPLGVQVAWLTGSQRGKARAKALAAVASGQASLVVGTHAVIQHDVHFARLGLAVVDEQHRFGVAQRLALRHKLAAILPPDTDTDTETDTTPPLPPQPAPSPAALQVACADPALPVRCASPLGGQAAPAAVGAPCPEAPGRGPWGPHLLMMSATPIPRTLAMTYFADLEVSTIDELPPGRTPIVTKLIAEHRRAELIARIADAVAEGQQVYWVCPLVEAVDDAPDAGPGSESRGRPLAELRNATETHAELAAALPGRSVGLIHGRLKPAEKAEVMARFKAGELAVLVATTVIEVGVDVPNASLMVVEHAERFGLAQLHQLRGRVGRGERASVCVLMYSSPLSDSGKQRLRAMAETTDGFEIARRDLEIRGPGEFMGARQSGDALLRFADLAEDAPLLAAARAAATRLLAGHRAAAEAQVRRWLGRQVDFLKA